MKKSTCISILIVFGLVFNMILVSGATLEVCPSGCTYSTIQGAIDASIPGDTIEVGAGTYAENIVIGKDNLILLGTSRDEVIIAPQAKDEGNPCSSTDGTPQFGIMVTGHDVIVRDLTVDGSAGDNGEGFRIGILNYDPNDDLNFGNTLIIENVNVYHSLRRGIAFWPTSTFGHIVRDSTISYVECQQGIYSSANSITITGNTISNAGMAIGLYPNVAEPSTATLTVSDNIIFNIAGLYSTYYGHSWPSVAIYYRNPNVDQTVVITGNSLSIGEGSEGISWGVTGMYIYNADENSIIEGNIIDSTNGANNYGIYLGGCAGTLVKDNELIMDERDSGIFLGRGSAETAVPNIITNNVLASTDSAIVP
jgi:parallel beta-helix repeat protein